MIDSNPQSGSGASRVSDSLVVEVSKMSSDDSDEESSQTEYQDESEDDRSDHAYVGKLVPQSIEKALFTKKYAPAFDGKMPWFTFEDAVEDWVDITESKPEKQGLELRNRLTGDAEYMKNLLEKEKLKDPDNGVTISWRRCVSYTSRGMRSFFSGDSFNCSR